jgi:hypothetical protein
MSASNKIDLYKDFAACVYLSGGQEPREKVRGATVQKAGSKLLT